MKIAPLSDIECVVLHDHFSPIDGERIHAFVQDEVRKAGYSSVATRLERGEHNVHVLAGDYHIFVSQIPEPLDPAGFKATLDQPITAIRMPDAKMRVERHKAHTFISIGKGIPDGVEATIENAMAPRDFTRWSEAEPAMRAAFDIARFIIAHTPPTAVHWLPSDNFVTPEFFEGVVQSASMTPLYTRPYLYSSAGHLGEGLPVGLVSNGAQYIVGRPVEFREAIVDLEWMIQRSCNFIDMVALRRAPIPHGETFGVEADERIEVIHHEPGPERPLGKFELVVRCAPRFGIGSREDAATTTAWRNATPGNDDLSARRGNLDPDDPVDLAILVALEERQRNGTVLPQMGDRRVGSRDQHVHQTAPFGRPAVAFGKRR